MPTKADRRAAAKYQAAHIKQVLIKLNDRTDQDILSHLEGVDNVQGYLKSLIRADMARIQTATEEKEEHTMASIITAADRARTLEAKKKAVEEGKSRIFANWQKFAGITKEEFIDALEWLHDDPMPDGKLTRELGCTMPANAGIPADKIAMWGESEEHAPGVDGLHRLSRHYHDDGSFAGFADEHGRSWGGIQGCASISCIDKI